MRVAFRESIQTVALAISFVLLLQATIQNFRVEGPSMNPTYADYDRVIVNKLAYLSIEKNKIANIIPTFDRPETARWYPLGRPSFGDIVVFRWPRNERQILVKRVIGVPGDTIEIENGRVIRNGIVLKEPYVVHNSNESLVDRVIPLGKYIVMGDNRSESDDSRHWGWVPEENIIGEVWLNYWPLPKIDNKFLFR